MPLHLIAYDIAAPARLRKVARRLEGCGHRLQQSVFACRLTDAQTDQLAADLDALVAPERDSLFAAPLCAGCRARIQTWGRSLPMLGPASTHYVV